ncbi:MAG: metallophosphoesterase [Anaerolineae bacterium]|nr:metallophosphoesterase [Anaerolineae bacterium]
MPAYQNNPQHQRKAKAGRRREVWLRKWLPWLYNRADPKWIEVKPVSITLPRLPAAFNEYRVVQISDIHMGTWMTSERLRVIVDLVNQQEADVIAITGDFVSYNAELWKNELITILQTLHSNDAVVGTLGNHDYWSDPEIIMDIMRDSQIIALTNDVFAIRRGDDKLNFCGVSSQYVGQDRLDLVIEKLDHGECNILLAHEPDIANQSAASGYFDLQLSGHAHGGQFILPFWGPVLRVRHAHDYPMGKYQIGEMVQYTSRGLGTSSIPLRINCPPEITVFTLRTR